MGYGRAEAGSPHITKAPERGEKGKKKILTWRKKKKRCMEERKVSRWIGKVLPKGHREEGNASLQRGSALNANNFQSREKPVPGRAVSGG